MAQKANDPRRGFQIGDDAKPVPVATPTPAAGASNVHVTDIDGAVSRGQVNAAEVRLRCLEALKHLQFRELTPAALIAAAAELEDYVLNGKSEAAIAASSAAAGTA